MFRNNDLKEDIETSVTRSGHFRILTPVRSFLAQTKACKDVTSENLLRSESHCFQMGLFPLHDPARNARRGATHSTASTCDAFDGDFKEWATGYLRRSRIYRIPFPFRAFSLHRITSPALEDRPWYGSKQAQSLAPRSVAAGYRESGGIHDR